MELTHAFIGRPRFLFEAGERKASMRYGKTLLCTALVAGFAALPLSPASAYPCNPVTGVFGAAATVAGAAVTIGTAPLVILAGEQPHFVDYTCGYHRTGYYRGQVVYEGPPVAYDTTPPDAYGPPPDYDEYAPPPREYDDYSEPPPPPEY